MSAALVPGGQMIVSTPNFGHWYPRGRVLTGTFDYDRRGILDEGHLRFFTRRGLRAARSASRASCSTSSATPVSRSACSNPAPGGRCAGCCAALDRALVRLRPTLFGYQFVATLHIAELREHHRSVTFSAFGHQPTPLLAELGQRAEVAPHLVAAQLRVAVVAGAELDRHLGDRETGGLRQGDRGAEEAVPAVPAASRSSGGSAAPRASRSRNEVVASFTPRVPVTARNIQLPTREPTVRAGDVPGALPPRVHRLPMAMSAPRASKARYSVGMSNGLCWPSPSSVTTADGDSSSAAASPRNMASPSPLRSPVTRVSSRSIAARPSARRPRRCRRASCRRRRCTTSRRR